MTLSPRLGQSGDDVLWVLVSEIGFLCYSKRKENGLVTEATGQPHKASYELPDYVVLLAGPIAMNAPVEVPL